MVLTVAKVITAELTLEDAFSFAYSELNKCFKHIPEHISDLAVILCLLQVLDGSLTSVGVSLFGTEAEGNPALRILMEQIGYGSTLIIAKGLAVLIIAYLASISHEVKWIKHAFLSSIIFYLTLAIFPWVSIISSHFS